MIKIIDMRQGRDAGLFDKLVGRNRLGQGEVVKTVEEILSNVRAAGDKAVFEYTRKFDKVEMDASSIKVSQQELKEAYDKIDPKLLTVIRKAKANIEAFHQKQ